MTRSIDHSSRDELAELRPFPWSRFRCGSDESVIASMQHDGGDLNLRSRCQLLFHVQKTLLAGRVEIPMPIRVDYTINEVRIVE